jgi:hypothetical protein
VEDHFFHLFLKDGVFYCCISDDPDFRDQKVYVLKKCPTLYLTCKKKTRSVFSLHRLGTRRNFAFLDQICTEFTSRHRAGRIKTAHAYALDKNFSPTVRSAMHYHNINHKSIAQEERVKKVIAKVDDMTRVMGATIHLLLERGQKLDKLMKTSQDLEQDAQVFKKRSAQIKARERRRYWVKNIMLISIIVFLSGTFSYIVITGLCGKDLQQCRRVVAGVTGSDGDASDNAGEGQEDAAANAEGQN